MMKKLLLAAAVVLGSAAFAQTSQADDCYRGPRFGHSHHYRHGYARRPVVSVTVPRYGVYRPPLYRHPGSLYRGYSPYRGVYVGPRAGFGPGFGPGFGYNSFGPSYRGFGMGIGFGF